MASIPLPALSIKPPQAQNPLETIGSLMQLKSLQQEQQLREAQIQGAGLQNQEHTMDLQSRQGMLRAYQEANGDLTKALPLASKYNVSPKDVISLQQAAFQQRQNAMTELKTKGELAMQQADLMQGAHDAVAKAPPEQRPAVYQQQIAGLQQAGIDTSQAPPQYPGDEQFALMGVGVKGHKQVLEELAKQAETDKNKAQTKEADANAQIHQAEADSLKSGGMTQQMADSQYRVIQQLPKTQWTPQQKAFVAAYEKQKTLVPAATFNLQNGVPAGGLQNSAMVKGLADGSFKWNDVVAQRTPMVVKEEIANAVKALNPNFNSGDFDVEKKVREKFTSGNVSDQLMAINTAREHMKTFSSLADALANGDTQAANKIGNAFGVQFGSDKATNFRIASQAFGGEVGKAFDGAGVTQGERAEAQHNFSENMSPAQFKGAIKTVDALLAGKQRSAQQSYDSGTSGKPNFGNQGGGGKEIHYKIVNGQLVQQ